MVSMTEMSYLDAIREAQIEEMTRDESVIIMGQDLRASLYGNAGLADLFGDRRVRDVPTSETACVGAALGAAMTGLRPVMDMTSASFCFVAMDQFVSGVSKAHYATNGRVRLPVVYRVGVIYEGGVGVQHSDRPHPWFMSMPGLKVMSPTTPADAKAMLKAAVRDDDPVIFIEDTYCWSMKADVADDVDDVIEIGSAAVRRTGDEVTVVGIGRAALFAHEAAEQLADEVSVEVIDLRSLAPIDWATIFASVEKTGRLLVVDPAVRICSAASEIAATVGERRFSALRAPIRRLTSPMVHTPYSQALEKGMYPDVPKVVHAIRTVARS
jgi:pyruvate/2-oxoglutarate/acetoin dehydrogenase E1 component